MTANSPRSAGSLELLPRESFEVQDERHFILSLIKYPDQPVLDVGTGDCVCVASLLAERGHQVVALDSDAGAIRAAQKLLREQEAGEKVRLLRRDITASRLESTSFLNIVCFNVLHHVPEYEKALAELRRILAPGGRLIISDYDENGSGFLEKLEHAVGRYFPRVSLYHRPGERLLLLCEN